MTSTDPLHALQAERQALDKQWRPLMARSVELSRQIETILRGRGELYIVTAREYGGRSYEAETEETLESAKAFARAIESAGSDEMVSITGPGINLTDPKDWAANGE